MWQQTLITLRARPRGFHLVTDELLAGLPELKACRVGLLHLWLQHTSASLTINENADPAVRRDFERFFNRLIPQGADGYEHNDEGLTTSRRTSRPACLAARSVCRYRQAVWHWEPGKAFTWASTVIMAVPVKSSPPCTVKGHHRWSAAANDFSGDFR